jgi:uncharacterized membrane protein YeiB
VTALLAQYPGFAHKAAVVALAAVVVAVFAAAVVVADAWRTRSRWRPTPKRRDEVGS